MTRVETKYRRRDEGTVSLGQRAESDYGNRIPFFLTSRLRSRTQSVFPLSGVISITASRSLSALTYLLNAA